MHLSMEVPDVALREALFHAALVAKSRVRGPSDEEINECLRRVEVAVQLFQQAHKIYHGTVTRDLDSSGWRLHWINKAESCYQAVVALACYPCVFNHFCQAVRAIQDEIFQLGEHLAVLKSAPTNAAALAGVVVLEHKLVDLSVLALSLCVCQL